MLKKPIVAAILSILIVLVSSVISVHARLDPACKDLTREFRRGDICEALTQYCSFSAETLLLAKNNGVDVKEASNYTVGLQKALEKETPGKIYARFQQLKTSLNAVKASLLRAELNETDRSALERLDAALNDAQTKINESEYNSNAAFFLRKELGRFSCFVARLCGVELPEQFA